MVALDCVSYVLFIVTPITVLCLISYCEDVASEMVVVLDGAVRSGDVDGFKFIWVEFNSCHSKSLVFPRLAIWC